MADNIKTPKDVETRIFNALVRRNPKEVQRFLLELKAKDVFDVSGAGDTVISTLATYHSRGNNLVDAAKIANLAAQHVVGQFGTTPIEQTELSKYI